MYPGQEKKANLKNPKKPTNQNKTITNQPTKNNNNKNSTQKNSQTINQKIPKKPDAHLWGWESLQSCL